MCLYGASTVWRCDIDFVVAKPFPLKNAGDKVTMKIDPYFSVGANVVRISCKYTAQYGLVLNEGQPPVSSIPARSENARSIAARLCGAYSRPYLPPPFVASSLCRNP